MGENTVLLGLQQIKATPETYWFSSLFSEHLFLGLPVYELESMHKEIHKANASEFFSSVRGNLHWKINSAFHMQLKIPSLSRSDDASAEI